MAKTEVQSVAVNPGLYRYEADDGCTITKATGTSSKWTLTCKMQAGSTALDQCSPHFSSKSVVPLYARALLRGLPASPCPMKSGRKAQQPTQTPAFSVPLSVIITFLRPRAIVPSCDKLQQRKVLIELVTVLSTSTVSICGGFQLTHSPTSKLPPTSDS